MSDSDLQAFRARWNRVLASGKGKNEKLPVRETTDWYETEDGMACVATYPPACQNSNMSYGIGIGLISYNCGFSA